MTDYDLFLAARAIFDTSARARFLDEQCGGDADRRARVEHLLAADPLRTEPHVPADPARTSDHVDSDDSFEAAPGAAGGEAGTVIAGRYTLVERIGEGGMGEVWVAKQTEPVNRQVAVKLIKAGMDSRAVLARFETERQALALMDHPNIARVYDGGVTPDRRPFFVMELIQGRPLTRYCDEARLGIRERLELFVPICQAVQHAHQKGIIHRDLKPSNVLIAEYDGRPVPKVIDFGVAKATGGKLTDDALTTQFGAVVGTLEYMAPEQAGLSGEDVDTRADIYSLGVILYELLTGLRPFDAARLRQAALHEVLRIIREEDPSKPSTRVSTADALPSLAAVRQIEPARLTRLLRGELDWVVMRCLEKDRVRRYETANGLARDVQRFLADEPVEARPPSVAYRTRKLLRRNRGPAVAAAVVLLALVGGIAGTTVGLVRARAAEQDAVEAYRAEARRAESEQQAREDAQLSAAAEKRANEHAQKRLKQVEAGLELLVNVYVDIDPRAEEKENKPLRVIIGERLARAAEQLSDDAIGDPVIVALLQTRLAATLINLGLADRAVPILTRARDVIAAAVEPDHEFSIANLNHLAKGYIAIGRRDLALPLLERSLASNKTRLGDDHLETIQSKGNLAVVYHNLGQSRRALPLMDECYTWRKARLGPDDPTTLMVMSDLAMAYMSTLRYDRAASLMEECLKLSTGRLGATHYDTLLRTNNLARIYMAAGRNDRALPMLESVLESWTKTQGVDHPETLRSMRDLALSSAAAGRRDRAVRLLEDAVPRMRAKFGPDHDQTLAAMHDLATNYHAAGRTDRAMPLLEDTHRRMTATLGPDHHYTVQAATNLAGLHLLAGRPDRAVPPLRSSAAAVEREQFEHKSAELVVRLLVVGLEQLGEYDQSETWRRKWAAVVKKRSGARSPAYASELAFLGRALLYQQKSAEAEALLREAVSLRGPAADDWHAFAARAFLGDALRSRGEYAEAAELLRAGYEGLKARAAKIPAVQRVMVAEAADRLVALYAAWGKPDEAAKWRAERAKYPPERAPPPRVATR